MKPAFSKWTRTNFEVVNHLHPIVRPVFREFLLRAAMAGVYGRIDPKEGGTRTADIQHDIYLRGDTWVECPYSMHCKKQGKGGFAIDFIVLKRVAILDYEYEPRNSQREYDILRKIALQLGIDNGRVLWGVDDAHFHYTGNLTTKQVAQGRMPAPPEFDVVPKDEITKRVMKRLGIV